MCHCATCINGLIDALRVLTTQLTAPAVVLLLAEAVLWHAVCNGVTDLQVLQNQPNLAYPASRLTSSETLKSCSTVSSCELREPFY